MEKEYAPKKDIICAVCHKVLRGRWRRRLIWCGEHRHYVCIACWDRKCLHANLHDAFRSHPGTTIYNAYAVLILVWFVLPFIGVVMFDLGTAIHWNGMRAEPIGTLPDSGMVKVLGTVNSTRTVALGGTEDWFGDEYGGEWKWLWNSSDTFWVEDGTGRVRVDCSGYYRIESSHHRAPNARYSEGTVYFNNDTVCAVGTVQREGETIVLRLLAMYPSDTGLELPLFWTFLAALCLGGIMDAGIWIWYCSRLRKRLHALATADIMPSPEPLSGFEFERDVKKERRNKARFCLAMIAGSAIIAAYFLIARPHAATDMFWLGLVVSMAITFPWILGLGLLFDANNR